MGNVAACSNIRASNNRQTVSVEFQFPSVKKLWRFCFGSNYLERRTSTILRYKGNQHVAGSLYAEKSNESQLAARQDHE